MDILSDLGQPTTYLGLPIWGLLVISAVILFLLYVAFLRRWTKLSKFFKEHDGPRGIRSLIPFLGSCEAVTQYTFFQLPRKYGPRYNFSLLNHYYFFSSKFEDVEILLGNRDHLNKPTIYGLFDTIANGLISIKGDEWTLRRKVLNPCFSFGVLKSFQPSVNKLARLLVFNLDQDDLVNGGNFNVYPYMAVCAFDILCATVFGTPMFLQRDRNFKICHDLDRLLELLQARAARPWLYPDFMWKLSSYYKEHAELTRNGTGFRSQILARRKEILKKMERLGVNCENWKDDWEDPSNLEMTDPFSPIPPPTCLVDMLLDASKIEGSGVTEDTVGYEMDTFSIGGFDTSAAALSWFTHFMATHPDKQNKLHEELDRVFGTDKNRDLTYDDLASMKYLEYCLKETLRIRPSIPFLGRLLDKDLQLNDGLIIPAGVNFMVTTMDVHRDEKYFPHPDQFIPERFSPEDQLNGGKDPVSYMPFSFGPRNCIGHKYGMNGMKTVLAYLFRSYSVETDEKLEDISIISSVTLRPSSGVHIRLKIR